MPHVEREAGGESRNNVDERSHGRTATVSASLSAVIAPTWPAPMTAAFGLDSTAVSRRTSSIRICNGGRGAATIKRAGQGARRYRALLAGRTIWCKRGGRAASSRRDGLEQASPSTRLTVWSRLCRAQCGHRVPSRDRPQVASINLRAPITRTPSRLLDIAAVTTLIRASISFERSDRGFCRRSGLRFPCRK